MLRSLLIPLDLSPSSDRVVARAALLPLPPGGKVTLLHVVPRLLQRESRARAEADAQRALEAAARRVGPMLPRGTVVRTVISVGAAAAEISRQAKSSKAGLIVVGRGGGRALRDVFLGSTAERVIREGQLPVLVVRLPPRAPYLRPAIALDLDQAAGDALAGLLTVIPTPHPRITAIHAYDTPYQGLIYPSLSADAAEDYRHEHREKALRALERLLTTTLQRLQPSALGRAWETVVQHGSARTVIERAVKKVNADLLVLGTHGYSGVAHAFLGTVAGDVLREVGCDVLVVPPGVEPG